LGWRCGPQMKREYLRTLLKSREVSVMTSNSQSYRALIT
jgi:hypothetical protein